MDPNPPQICTARQDLPPILLGTSSWTADGWKTAFYPPSTPIDQYLTYYTRCFYTVEIDSTFYRIPSASTVAGWQERTPPGFILAAKAPRIITHDKILQGAIPDLVEFCRAMEPLGSRLGPLLLQFPYFNRQKIGLKEFLDRLRLFLAQLPSGFQWALEIRNRAWLGDALLDLLRNHQVAFTLIDHPWMPGPLEYGSPVCLATAPFSYVRWLGDRHKIEELTTTWDHTVIDRTSELKNWADLLREMLPRARPIYAYANNHYAGYSPDTLRQFEELWGQDLLPDPAAEDPSPSLTLF